MVVVILPYSILVLMFGKNHKISGRMTISTFYIYCQNYENKSEVIGSKGPNLFGLTFSTNATAVGVCGLFSVQLQPSGTTGLILGGKLPPVGSTITDSIPSGTGT